MTERVTIPLATPGSRHGYVPTLVSWNVTFRCNLRCVHCYLDAGTPGRGDELSYEEGISLIDALTRAGTRILILSGGEPLLRDDLFDLAHYGTKKGLHLAMGTNGTLINEEVAYALKEVGIRKVAISLDSVRPADHDRFRGRTGAWEKAIQGIKACREAGVPVQIHATVTPFNHTEIESILAFGEQLGARDFQLFFLVPAGRGRGVGDIVPDQYEGMIRAVLQYTAGKAISVRPTCAPQFIRIARQIGAPTEPGTRGCMAGLTYCRIYPSGEVTPCPYLPVRLASVREQPFQEIWDDAPVLRELRDFRLLEGRCGKCAYAEVCRGCRARAFGASLSHHDSCGVLLRPSEAAGNYLAEDPSCLYQPEAV
ncbi:MAG: radical SAM protein [Methanomicrobiales archaeon]|nr:radical SAM protein [Methanomicrobiales archaeon]